MNTKAPAAPVTGLLRKGSRALEKPRDWQNKSLGDFQQGQLKAGWKDLWPPSPGLQVAACLIDLAKCAGTSPTDSQPSTK